MSIRGDKGYLYLPALSPVLQFVFTRSRPQFESICVCLLFVLLLQFVIVTVSTYINSVSTYT